MPPSRSHQHRCWCFSRWATVSQARPEGCKGALGEHRWPCLGLRWHFLGMISCPYWCKLPPLSLQLVGNTRIGQVPAAVFWKAPFLLAPPHLVRVGQFWTVLSCSRGPCPFPQGRHSARPQTVPLAGQGFGCLRSTTQLQGQLWHSMCFRSKTLQQAINCASPKL